MANDTVQARVPRELKQQADQLFNAMGLKTSDAIRMFLQQSVTWGKLPFQPTVKQPNAETLAAMRELEEGGGERFETVEALLADLYSDDDDDDDAPHSSH